ncbi:2-oxo acid dehydrogenase subunit E2 [Methyloligella solikamskensis]|uniref:2-oxo acid dehydrogenase subunit E2 n=1 Tax=Methyloligella solikamskensis TaxID=1177756 RepID=A0ABW3JA94_9HYPH
MDRLIASPYAKRLAKEQGIDLARLTGSGPNGRIIARDIESAPRQAPAAKAATSPQALSDETILALYEPESYDRVEHSTMSRMIAEKLSQAKATIPHFYLTIDCELDALLATRRKVNAASPAEGPDKYRISVNDFLIKAMALALQKVPKANATWTQGGMLFHKASDVGVAVALEEGGLHTPIVRDADTKTLRHISDEMKDLAKRARGKRLAPHEYQGGVTAISNLGMYGIREFSAIINPPQASILAVGKAEKQLVPRGEEIATVTTMTVTLSCDHRVIDGVLGAKLLAAFKGFVEDPVMMLI